jgi:hypothetical protein
VSTNVWYGPFLLYWSTDNLKIPVTGTSSAHWNVSHKRQPNLHGATVKIRTPENSNNRILHASIYSARRVLSSKVQDYAGILDYYGSTLVELYYY